MKFEYKLSGVLASLTIISTVFEFRKHNRVVDRVLLSTDVRAKRTGIVVIKSVISGKTPAVMRAYKVAQKEAAR